ncbi:ABC transporter substrate-binding protein [Paenibacillus roseus]
MRRYKLVSLLTMSFLIVLSGCSSGSSHNKPQDSTTGSPAKEQVASNSKPAEPAKGGELNYALATSPDSLDPQRTGLAVTVRVLHALYDTLVIQGADSSIQPSLATEWEVSPDGKTYTLKLRQDVTFHDGTPFKADAVKFSFDRIFDPATKASNSAQLIRPYESSEIVDDYTIKLHLSTPSNAFLSNLSQGQLAIVSPTAVAKEGDQFGKRPVGSGPFKFVEWQENTQIVVERNPDYKWAPGNVENKEAPYLERLTFKIVPEEATRIGGVQSKQIEAAETVPPQNILQLKNDANFQIFSINTGGLPYTLFINQENQPWNDLKARQALQSAIDVDAIVKTLYRGTYDRAWSPLAPTTFGYDKTLENSDKLDVDKANALLDELGWKLGPDGIREKDGKKLTLRYVDGSPNREKRNDIAAMVKQQLKKIGGLVEVVITKDVRSVVYEQSNYDIFGNSQVNSDPESLRAFYHSGSKIIGGRHNHSALNSPEVDEWIDQGRVETDNAKREELYKKVQQYVIDNAVIIPIYVFPYTVAALNKVQGLKFDALGYPLFNDVYIQN